jgi:hypothetical protein
MKWVEDLQAYPRRPVIDKSFTIHIKDIDRRIILKLIYRNRAGP